MGNICLNLGTFWPAVWGQMNPFERTRDYMNQPISFRGVGFLLVLAIAAATVWMILYWWEHRREHLPRRTVIESIFHNLCQVHGLSDTMIRQLEALARELSLNDPALLFVDPRPIEQRLAHATVDGAADGAAWQELGTRLFGQHFQPAIATIPATNSPPEI